MRGERNAWKLLNHDLVKLKLKRARKQHENDTRPAIKKFLVSFDDNLVRDKEDSLQEHNSEFLRGRILEIGVEKLELWLERMNKVYRATLHKQGGKQTPEFVRALFANAIMPQIEAGLDFANELIVLAKRVTRYKQLRPFSKHEWVDAASRLTTEWRERTDIAALECETTISRDSMTAERVTPGEKVREPDRYPIMRVDEVMQLFEVSRATVYRRLAEGSLQRAALGRGVGKRGSTRVRTVSVAEALKEDAE